MKDEMILAVPRQELITLLDGDDSSLILDSDRKLYHSLLEKKCFVSRTIAEQDPSYKQIIPYIFLRKGEQYLLLRRLAAQSEARLHNLYSLGVGGHVNDSDLAEGDPFQSGMVREFEEEISVQGHLPPVYRGLLNSETNEVGRYHLGLVYECVCPEGSPLKVLESDKMTGSWATVQELKQVYEQMEGWSKVVFDNLIFPVNG